MSMYKAWNRFWKIGGLCARAVVLLMLCLCMTPCGARAGGEAASLLNADDLRSLEPEYEAFLQKLADLLIDRGLIAQDDREDWLLYQLGDYYQNGGYGMIAAMFTPNLLDEAPPQDMLLRLQKELPGVGTLRIDTMRAYSPLDSAQPGLLLEAAVADIQGLPVACRFRWSSGQGGFSSWDALEGRVADVGNLFINDGRPFYWSDQPIAGQAPDKYWIIGLEIIDAFDDDIVLASATLSLTPEGSGWALDGDSLY